MEKPTQDGLDLDDCWPAISFAFVSHRLTPTGSDSRAVLYLHRGRGGRIYWLCDGR
jgi:hypothetical protein